MHNPTTLFLTLALSLAACGSKDSDDDTGATEVIDDEGGEEALDESDNDEGGTDEGGDDSSDPMTGTVSGSIVDEAGAVMNVANVKLCTPMLCRTTEPDNEGNFEFIELEEATFALEIKSDDENSATMMGFIDLSMEEARTLDEPIVVPNFRTSDNLGSTRTIAVDGGLNVSVDPGYEPPFGINVEEKIKGVHVVDPSTSGLPIDGIEGEIVGLWYLGTWNTLVPAGWSFTIDSLPGVAEGESLTVLTGDYASSSWVNEGTATVGADGSITADEGTGITFLSTFVLVR